MNTLISLNRIEKVLCELTMRIYSEPTASLALRNKSLVAIISEKIQNSWKLDCKRKSDRKWNLNFDRRKKWKSRSARLNTYENSLHSVLQAQNHVVDDYWIVLNFFLWLWALRHMITQLSTLSFLPVCCFHKKPAGILWSNFCREVFSKLFFSLLRLTDPVVRSIWMSAEKKTFQNSVYHLQAKNWNT